MSEESRSRWVRRAIFAGVCAAVIAIFAAIANTVGAALEWNPNPAMANYNLLVRGFQAGQLNLKREVPPGMATLPDPYDPVANAAYRHAPDNLHDTSYYRGKLYLYFGAVPALVLFWPWVALTGHYLFPRVAVIIFCAVGFLASAGILLAARRRYFPNTGAGVLSACALALGLATGIPVLLQRPGLCEVPISCGYAFAMLALAAVWRALHEPERRGRWLAAASLSYGLAVGSRPSLLFGAAILLIPIAQAWRRTEEGLAKHSPARLRVGLLAAVAGPIGAIGLALIGYNLLRFGNPLEFGQHYQLAGIRLGRAPTFSLRYLWFNFRVYFLQPEHLRGHFPFIRNISFPALPAGYNQLENPFPYGLLANVPLAWLALFRAFSLFRRFRFSPSPFRWFLGAVGLFGGISALTLCFYWGACARYEAEFLPALILLAVFGILGIERALEGRPVPRMASRFGWGALLAISIAFNLLASLQNGAEQFFYHGEVMDRLGRFEEATADYRKSLWFEPDQISSHLGIIAVLSKKGRLSETVPHYEQILRLRPNDPTVENDLAVVLGLNGRNGEAAALLETALRLDPNYFTARLNLGLVLARSGRRREAISHLQQALLLKPDSFDARLNLQLLQAEEKRSLAPPVRERGRSRPPP